MTYFDLDQEVPEVLFEGRNVLIQAEQAGNKHLHLGAEKQNTREINTGHRQHAENTDSMFSALLTLADVGRPSSAGWPRTPARSPDCCPRCPRSELR